MASNSKSVYVKSFVIISLIGSLLSLSSENWFTLWMGMEISTLSFTVIIASSQGFPVLVSSWKYLVFQSVGSLVIFLPMVAMKGASSPFLPFMVSVGVGVKMGMVPFHGWLLHLAEGAELYILFLLSSVQKMAPLVVVYNMYPYMEGFQWMILGSAVWSALLSMSGVTMKQFFLLSSILMTSWMSYSLFSWSSGVWFFLIYTVHLLLFTMSVSDVLFQGKMSSLYSSPSKSSWGSVVDSISLGAMLGLPPFGVFLMKADTISCLVSEGAMLAAFTLTLCSGLMIVGYMKVMIPFLLSGGPHWGVSPVKGVLFVILFTLPILCISWMQSFYKEAMSFWFMEELSLYSDK